jgi:hypothetical protein
LHAKNVSGFQYAFGMASRLIRVGDVEFQLLMSMLECNLCQGHLLRFASDFCQIFSKNYFKKIREYDFNHCLPDAPTVDSFSSNDLKLFARYAGVTF